MPVPQFVLDLRARIGQDLLWLTGVNAVTVDEHQHLLLARRADTGRWALVSGILEPGEQPAHGLAREVREETGVVVQPLRITSVISGRPVQHTNGDWAQYMSITFECRPTGGVAQVNDDESLEVGWFPLDALPSSLSAQDRQRITDALAAEQAAWFVPV